MKNHKLFIGIVALLVIALGAYIYFSGNSSSDKQPVTNTIVSSNTGSSPVALGNTTAAASTFAGSDIASMLKNISQIRLNTAILQNPSFLALVDTTLALPQTSVSGRVNPFGRSGALESATPASTQINSGATTTTALPAVVPAVTNTTN